MKGWQERRDRNINGIEIRLLRYFSMLAEERHFGVAAQRLGISQPPLSRAIQDLESRLGTDLIVRDSRPIKLTEAGRIFLEDAANVMNAMERAVERSRLGARGYTGQLDIGFFGSIIYDVLPRIMRAFHAERPQIDLRLHRLDKAGQVKALSDGWIDIGFNRFYRPHRGLRIETVWDEPIVAAVPFDSDLSDRKDVAVHEFEGRGLILFPASPRPSFADAVIRICQKAGFRPTVTHETGDAAMCLALVAAGRGSALVPLSARALAPQGVRYIPLAEPAPTTELSCMFREGTDDGIRGDFLAITKDVAGRFTDTAG